MRSLFVTWMAFSLAVLIGCDSNHSQPRFPSDNAVALANELLEAKLVNEVDVTRAIENARNAEQSVVLVRLDWSIDSHLATFSFAQFMLDYYASHPDSRLLFHCIDCTSITDDYTPLAEIPGWHELEGDGSLIQGYGEVAWLKNGRVLRVESFRGSWDIGAVDKFVAITDELMDAPR